VEFYASLTINRCHFDRLCDIWAKLHPKSGFPFAHAIVSPLFARHGILARLYQQHKNCKVILDSGGFHIQQGRMTLQAASRELRGVYLENQWAHRFTLPDAPIISVDSRKVISQKLASTRSQYREFPDGLPSALRRKFLPVVHGTTSKEVYRSAWEARIVGSKCLGFGGFSTSGPNAGVNSFTSASLRLFLEFTALCEKWKLDSHAFGIGGPASIAVLHYTSVKTFDSAGWLRTAAYGNVYLPYIGAVNITGAAPSRRFVSRPELRRLLNATGHACVFCENESLLTHSWLHRALHNYCTLTDAIRELDSTSAEETLEKLRLFNKRFATYLQFVLEARLPSLDESQPKNRGRVLNNCAGTRKPPRARMTRTLVG
jgi:hypothetical protein